MTISLEKSSAINQAESAVKRAAARHSALCGIFFDRLEPSNPRHHVADAACDRASDSLSEFIRAHRVLAGLKGGV